MYIRIVFAMAGMVAALNAAAQDFVLDGSAVIKLSVSQTKGVVPISLWTCFGFPAFDCAEVTDTISVDKKSVRLKVPVRSLQEADLTVGDKRIHLLMIPGDTIAIALSDATKDSNVEFNGTTKDVQFYYLQKSRLFPISVSQQMMNAGSRTTTLTDFKTKADDLYLQEGKFWKAAIANTVPMEGKIVQKNQQLPPWFIRYENDAMQYKNAMIRLYTIVYQEFMLKQKVEIPDGYLDFLKSIPFNNESAMHENPYQMFLLHYFGYMSDRGPGNDDHRKEFQLADHALSEKIAGLYKLSSISTSLGGSPSKVLQELDSIKLPATSQYLVDYLRKRANDKLAAVDPIRSAPDFYLEDKLDSLVSLSQFKGQVVYLSLWFAGCKPCVEEFPFENDLVKKFEGKPVKVVSICTHTSKAKWLEMIDTHKLTMVNLFANKAWETKIEKNYQVGAYPHYVLIGSDGRVIQNFAKRPREISNDIEKALGQ